MGSSAAGRIRLELAVDLGDEAAIEEDVVGICCSGLHAARDGVENRASVEEDGVETWGLGLHAWDGAERGLTDKVCRFDFKGSNSMMAGNTFPDDDGIKRCRFQFNAIRKVCRLDFKGSN